MSGTPTIPPGVLYTVPETRRTSPSHHFVARLWQHPPYFHDGSAATLDDGATPYNNFRLRLSVALQRDLVQLLKSLVPRLVTKISWIKITFAGEPVAWGCPRSGQVPRARPDFPSRKRCGGPRCHSPLHVGLSASSSTPIPLSRLAGIAKGETPGVPIATVFTGTEGGALSALLDRAARDGVELLDERIDTSSERASGWQCSVWPVITDDGRAEALGIEIRESNPPDDALDLQRQVAEQMLLGALRERGLADDAEMANTAKTAFLRAMSHELRTPLNAIGGYIDLLDMGLRGPVTEKQHADLARVRTNQQHLAALITEILNFARVGSGSVSYAVSDVNGCDALKHAIELIEPLIAQRGLVFDGISGDSGIVARADPEKVAQILVNLLQCHQVHTGGRAHQR